MIWISHLGSSTLKLETLWEIVVIRTLLWMNVQAMNRVWRGDKASYHFMYAVCNI